MTRVQITLLRIINRRERLPNMKQYRAYVFGGFGTYFSKSKLTEITHSQSTTGRGQVLQNLTQVM